MKILLAIDGSPCSDAAVEEVSRRPWPDGSSIKVLTAFELPMPPTPEAWALPVNYFEEMDVALSKQAQNIVDRAIAKLKPKLPRTIPWTRRFCLVRHEVRSWTKPKVG